MKSFAAVLLLYAVATTSLFLKPTTVVAADSLANQCIKYWYQGTSEGIGVEKEVWKYQNRCEIVFEAQVFCPSQDYKAKLITPTQGNQVFGLTNCRYKGNVEVVITKERPSRTGNGGSGAISQSESRANAEATEAYQQQLRQQEQRQREAQQQQEEQRRQQAAYQQRLEQQQRLQEQAERDERQRVLMAERYVREERARIEQEYYDTVARQQQNIQNVQQMFDNIFQTINGSDDDDYYEEDCDDDDYADDC